MFDRIWIAEMGGNGHLGSGQKDRGRRGGGGPEHFEMWWLENT